MKGILFRDDMAQAIYEGRKTETRRVVKGINVRWEDGVLQHDVEDGNYAVPIPCRSGEIVYVKECWREAAEIAAMEQASKLLERDLRNLAEGVKPGG